MFRIWFHVFACFVFTCGKFKVSVHQKHENYVINYLPVRSSKPLRSSFVFGKQIKIIWLKSEGSGTEFGHPCPRLQASRLVQSPEKMPSVIHWEYNQAPITLLCSHKTKITSLTMFLLLTVSKGYTLMSTVHWCIHFLVSNKTTSASKVIRDVNMLPYTGIEEKNHKIKSYFLFFFCGQNIFSAW